MREVILTECNETISIDKVQHIEPVFAMRDGKMKGMVVKENKGWILRVGGDFGCSGHSDTLEDCITDAANRHGYTFFVE